MAFTQPRYLMRVFVNKIDIVNDLLRPIGVDLSLCSESAESPCPRRYSRQFRALKSRRRSDFLARPRAILNMPFAAGYTATDFISVAADNAYVCKNTAVIFLRI